MCPYIHKMEANGDGQHTFMFTRRVWLKVAQKKMRASGASFCHMGVCTKPTDKGPKLRDACACRGMRRAH